MGERGAENPHRGVGDERAEESAPELWERLADEMRSAREEAGIRPSDRGDTPDVPWTRSHLSNLEHGRGRPTLEIAALYDERCPHPSGPLFFADLQTAATRAEGVGDKGQRLVGQVDAGRLSRSPWNLAVAVRWSVSGRERSGRLGRGRAIDGGGITSEPDVPAAAAVGALSERTLRGMRREFTARLVELPLAARRAGAWGRCHARCVASRSGD